MPEKTLVIGLGTGRCGTTSLSSLLNMQDRTMVSHERNNGGRQRFPFHWDGDYERIKDWMQGLLEADDGNAIVGDVGMYYLPYLYRLEEDFPSARFICLRRSKEGTVKSFLTKTQGRNHWTESVGDKWRKDDKWDPVFPKYNAESKKMALEMYWDDYYIRYTQFQNEYSSKAMLVELGDFNRVATQRAILEFVGLDNIRVKRNLKTNQKKTLYQKANKTYVRLKRKVKGYLTGS